MIIQTELKIHTFIVGMENQENFKVCKITEKKD